MESDERQYGIATGSSRYARRWRNERMTWGELRGRLSEPVRTRETAAEYRSMGRERQTDIKDVGGFVGGYLEDGVRRAPNVRWRSVVTLDYDTFDAVHLERVRRTLDCSWVMHSTHKHTAEAWRVRLVVPASRDITPDEYGAVARRLAEMCGMEGIDRSTFEPCRLMFWGSCPSDAPWLCEGSDDSGGARPLDVGAILEGYEDWRDVTSWPMAPDEEAVVRAGGEPEVMRAPEAARARLKGAGDPLAKKGAVGAFCRAYSVSDAIRTFLPGVYTHYRGARWTHTGSSTVGGAWVIGDRWLYSFHSTDPYGGRLLNAWDLVRLHLYGAEDSGTRETRLDRMPSTRLMTGLAMEDPGVRRALHDERRARAAGDFDGMVPDAEEGGGGTDGGTSGDGSRHMTDEEEWDSRRGRLSTLKDGSIRTTIDACVTVLSYEPRIKGRLRMNDFTGDIDVTGELPWRRTSPTWTNTDDAALRGWLDREYGISGKEKISDALVNVANARGYHPVREYLDGLEWDGTPRLRGLFTDVIGAENTELNRELARLLFTAAARRIYSPGEKFDYFIILHGPEGCGKSSLFSIMGGEWFSDSVVSIEGKDGMEAVQGAWIIELGELLGVKRSEVSAVKAFISRQCDKYRPPYGRVTESRPRQCVLVGTTNEELFLRGITTGNRRSPVVEVDPALRRCAEPVRDYVARWRDQLWAEAVELHRRGGPLMLSPGYDAEIRRVQDRHNLDKCNPLFPEIERFLELPLPAGWDITYSLAERQRWLESHSGAASEAGEGAGDIDSLMGFERRRFVTVAEILQEMLGMRRTERDYISRAREVGQFLTTLPGWDKIGTRRHKIYGSQMTWRRKATPEVRLDDL